MDTLYKITVTLNPRNKEYKGIALEPAELVGICADEVASTQTKCTVIGLKSAMNFVSHVLDNFDSKGEPIAKSVEVAPVMESDLDDPEDYEEK